MAFVSPEIILTIVGGILVTAFTGILKTYFSKYNPQYIVLFVALVMGGFYMGFKTFLPAELQPQIVNFALGSLGYSVLIYEFIWKNLNGTRE